MIPEPKILVLKESEVTDKINYGEYDIVICTGKAFVENTLDDLKDKAKFKFREISERYGRKEKPTLIVSSSPTNVVPIIRKKRPRIGEKIN